MDTDDRRLEALKQVLDAFNRHDLDAIMSHFADDCVFESPPRTRSGRSACRDGTQGRCDTTFTIVPLGSRSMKRRTPHSSSRSE
jgi:ketosteroid isomerase-like protein